MRKVLLIYTGGTIGMIKDYEQDSLKPFDFDHIFEEVPELNKLSASLTIEEFDDPIDSSSMTPEIWVKLASILEDNYNKYDGFVILHGSDTMAYTASALSFMLENLSKPVILTGSQLPIGTLRTDGKENLITALELASAYQNDKARVPEVAIYFEYSLYRGNRSRKVDAQQFKAFESLNYPLLAEAGVKLQFNDTFIMSPADAPLKVNRKLENQIHILKLFPGISDEVISSVCKIENLKGLIVESYGSGNPPANAHLMQCLTELINREIPVVNITQCHGGSVSQGKYLNSRILNEIGVTSGKDLTTEAAVTKLMHLLGLDLGYQKTVELMQTNLRGEMSDLL